MISTPTLHPFLSHFPAAMFVAAGLLLYLGKKQKKESLLGAASLNLSFGLLASILASLSGMFASDLQFRPTVEVEGHQGYAFALVLMYTACTVYSYTSRFSTMALWCYGLTLILIGAAYYSGYGLTFHTPA